MRKVAGTILALIIVVAVAGNLGFAIQNIAQGKATYWDIAAVSVLPVGLISGWVSSIKRFGVQPLWNAAFGMLGALVGMIPAGVLAKVFELSLFPSLAIGVVMGILAGYVVVNQPQR